MIRLNDCVSSLLFRNRSAFTRVDASSAFFLF